MIEGYKRNTDPFGYFINYRGINKQKLEESNCKSIRIVKLDDAKHCSTKDK